MGNNERSMGAWEAIVRGFRQAIRAPKLVLLLWAASLAVAAPAALILADELTDSFGASLVAERMTAGFDMDWHAEHGARARGLAGTFGPSLAGPGVVLDNLDAWLTGEMFRTRKERRRPGVGQPRSGKQELRFPGLVVLGVTYAVVWAFLLGAVLGRLARAGEGFGLERLAAVGGKFFFRFVGLALLSGVLYFLVYLLARLLYGAVEDATRDVTEERLVLLSVLAVAAVVVVLLHLIRMAFDYAKIATVLEDRRSVVGSAWAGLRMVARHPLRTGGVYLCFSATAALFFVLYALTAPGAGPSSLPGVVLAFLFAQLYLVSRLLLRVGLLGAELNLYRDLSR